MGLLVAVSNFTPFLQQGFRGLLLFFEDSCDPHESNWAVFLVLFPQVNGLEYNEDQRYLLSILVWRLATEVGCPRIESSFNRENSPKLVAIK